MTSYRGDEAIDWFGFSRLWSQTVGYAVTTSRIDSLNRRKTLSESLASARLLFMWCVQQRWTTLAGASPVTVIASEPCS